jgi:hypothetical protein
MLMALVGQELRLPVCYVHERYRALIYLPALRIGRVNQPSALRPFPIDLPESSVPRNKVLQLSGIKHHRPKSWTKVEKMLCSLPWVEKVYYDERAYAAPRNGVKAPRQTTRDGCHIIWMHLEEDKQHRMAIAIETTGHSPEHVEKAATVLRQGLGRLL